MTKTANQVRMTPLADRVVLLMDDADEITPGGIVLPDVAQDQPTTGLIVAVGPGKTGDDGERVGMDVTEGETVMVGRYSGSDVEVDGVSYKILKQDDIYAIIED